MPLTPHGRASYRPVPSPGTITCYFDLPVTPQLTVEPDVRELLGGTFPAEGRTFPVPTERVAEALDLLSALEPQPTNPWGMAPVWLTFSANFALRGPDGDVWPGQDPSEFGFFETPTGLQLGASKTILNIEARRSMGLLLSVPDATDADLAVIAPLASEPPTVPTVNEALGSLDTGQERADLPRAEACPLTTPAHRHVIAFTVRGQIRMAAAHTNAADPGVLGSPKCDDLGVDNPGRNAGRRRLTIWSLVSSLGTVGAILFVLTRGTSAWIGLGVLVTAVILGFLDGYKGWSERHST